MSDIVTVSPKSYRFTLKLGRPRDGTALERTAFRYVGRWIRRQHADMVFRQLGMRTWRDWSMRQSYVSFDWEAARLGGNG